MHRQGTIIKTPRGYCLPSPHDGSVSLSRSL
jgi:hypothetical protein